MHNASIPDYFYLFSFTYCIFPDVSVFILSKTSSTGLYPWLLEFLTLGSMPPRSRRMEVLSYLCLEVSLHTASASGKKSRQGDKHWTQDYLVLSLGLLIPCVCHRARLTLHVSCISPWQQGLGLGLVYSLWYHNAQQHVPRKCRHSLYVGGVNECLSLLLCEGPGHTLENTTCSYWSPSGLKPFENSDMIPSGYMTRNWGSWGIQRRSSWWDAHFNWCLMNN